MELIQNKDKRTGLIGTIIFHIILLILFFIFGLETPVPIPEDRGATIEFGWSNTGSGVTESQVQTPITTPEEQPTPTNTSQPVTAVEEEAVTQTESEISAPDISEETSEPDPEPEPTISDDLSRALEETWSTPAGGGNQGDTEGPGNQGSPDGAPGKGALGGGQGDWELAGRSLVSGYSIKDTKEEGVVVLDITVDRQGNVLTAKWSPQSNTTSTYLTNKAIHAAKRYKFSPKSNAAIEQRGKIRFIFQLQ